MSLVVNDTLLQRLTEHIRCWRMCTNDYFDFDMFIYIYIIIDGYTALYVLCKYLFTAICGPGSTYEFAWQYETEYTVDLTIWRHKSSTGVETDIMYKYPDKDAMHYPGIFENRTEELPGFNAGMIVRDLHDTDTGNFSYEVTLNEVPVPIENFTDISVSLNGGKFN